MRISTLLCAALALGSGTHDQTDPRNEALAGAFRFASAIVADRNDQGKAQEAVVGDMAAAGMLDEAIRRADEIAGWRRGTAYADLAARLAIQGRPPEARDLTARAQAVHRETTGWQQKRVEMHIARAEAALGDRESAERAAHALAAEDQQYEGRAEALGALALAAGGQADEALRRLSRLDGAGSIDATATRTRGYLDVASQPGLAMAIRLEALRRARRSAEGMPGILRAEGLVRVAQAQIDLGAARDARETLLSADPMISGFEPTLPLKASLQAAAAAAWSRAGDSRRARRLLESVVKDLPAAPVIDRPAGYAHAAAGYVAAGDPDRAGDLFAEALSSAGDLMNARPRALALVEICRAMARARWSLDEADRSRMQALLAGLKDPW